MIINNETFDFTRVNELEIGDIFAYQYDYFIVVDLTPSADGRYAGVNLNTGTIKFFNGDELIVAWANDNVLLTFPS